MPKTYWQLFYHLVWTTKERLPLISEDIRNAVITYIQAKCDDLGCILHAAEATADHVHILASVPPSIQLSDFARDIKGGSSHLINQELNPEAPFYWQRGCGIISVSSHDKARVIKYIECQRRRHQVGDLWPSLEHAETETSPP